MKKNGNKPKMVWHTNIEMNKKKCALKKIVHYIINSISWLGYENNRKRQRAFNNGVSIIDDTRSRR